MSSKAKSLPNLITLSRIIAVLAILLLPPFSLSFFGVYLYCGISDVLDGVIARKTNTVSKTGQTLDSIADFLFAIVFLIILFTEIQWPELFIGWTAVIFVVRVIALVVGAVRFKQIVFLHTISNKITGFGLFIFPFLFSFFGFRIPALAICIIASFSSTEELLINLTSNSLDRDRKTLFEKSNN